MLPTVYRSANSSVALLGAGSQGRRLAYMWSSMGKDVHLIDAQQKQLSASVQAVETMRATLAPSGTLGKIKTYSTESLATALQNTWLVVECVPEQLPLKQQVIMQLDDLAPENTIIASNSSSYSCSEIIDGLPLKKKSRILSAHTYWPPETSIIEIMGHKETDSTHVDTMMASCLEHGFTPFHVKQPSMGYIYNRIWAAIKREALLTAAEGAAAPEEIDAIFKGVLKTAKGPFELMDIVGLDVVLDIEQHYASARQDIPNEPQKYLSQFLQLGHLGVKSGRGFYDYAGHSTV